MHPKVVTGGLAGAMTLLGVWALGYFAHVTVPPDVASAATLIIGAGCAHFIGSNTATSEPPAGKP